MKGITNAITVAHGKPTPSAAAQFRAALERSYLNLEKEIRFYMEDTTMVLSGRVATSALRAAIERTAWKTPGVVFVQNEIMVEPTAELVVLA